MFGKGGGKEINQTMGGARGVGNSGLSTRRAAKRQAKPVGKVELSMPLSAGGAKAPARPSGLVQDVRQFLT